jgi:hypothetical protein
MPTTSNFGWTTPADTDLVKDGAAAIRTLGNGIDTSFLDLKGGTTGQVLSKNSNTDLDYTWVTPNVGDITEVQAGTGISVASGTGPIPVVTNTVATAFDAAGDLVYGTGADTFTKLSLGTAGQVLKVNSGATAPEWAVDPTTDVVTTAGDLIYGTAADTVARLGIGTAGQVLKVNSGATAPEWGAAASGALTLVSSTAIGSGVGTVTVSSAFSSTYDNYLIVISGGVASNNLNLTLQLGSTTSGYYYWGQAGNVGTSAPFSETASNAASFATAGRGSTNSLSAVITLLGPNLAKTTHFFSTSSSSDTNNSVRSTGGFENSTTQHTAFTIGTGGNNITGGTIKVYGYQN